MAAADKASTDPRAGKPDADPARVLERARAHDLAAAAGDVDGLWRRVSAETVLARPSFVTRLRELPTSRRVGFVLLGTMALVLGMVLVAGTRVDLGGTLMVRYALAMLGLTVLAGAVFAVALRGAHQRPLGWIGWLLTGLGVAVPLGLSLVPSLWSGESPHAHGVVDGCVYIGCATGAFAATLAWIFQRATTPVMVRALASAAGGGVIAFAMLQLHCPANDVEHLVIGHSLVGILLVAAAALVVFVQRLASRRAR